MTVTTKFWMTRDINGYNGFGLQPATDIFGGALVAGVAQSITVPSNYPNWLAIFMFGPGTSIWCRHNGTATVPAGAMAAISSELNPSAWWVQAGDTISMITADASDVIAVKLYGIGPN
jgi:hypothetical protein